MSCLTVAQLSSEPAATLADVGSLPAATSSPSSAAASLQSAVDESPVVVVATTKLEGELAAQFQKVRQEKGYSRVAYSKHPADVGYIHNFH